MLDLPVPLRPITAARSEVSSAKSAPSSNATCPNARWALVRVRRAMKSSWIRAARGGLERVLAFGRGSRTGTGDVRLERVDEHLRHVEAGLIGDFLEAGRAGDVDLGEDVADHVQADQHQAAAGELGADDAGDLAFALGDGARH